MKLLSPIFFLIVLVGCNHNSPSQAAPKQDLGVDHLNIWVKNPNEAKKKLREIGFTVVPDSLSTIHKGQGTTGRYFYFLNGYLELIYVYNEAEFFENAQSNPALDFVERSKSPENGYLPFSIALKMKEHDKAKIPFKTVEYSQDWMGEQNKIYVAKNSKIKKEEPSLFVIYPEIKFDTFENLEDLSKIPDEYSIFRSFYKHANGAEKISGIKIHTNNIEKESKTIISINALEKVEIIEGKEYLMELYFDDQRQGKVYDLRPEIPLKIYL